MIQVLLVDDQELFRIALHMVIDLDADVAVVGEAADGDQAIAMVGQLHPDVVLMDVRMPGIDGIAATEQIVTRYPDCRVLVLTTFNADQYVLDCLRAGASGFLLKDTPPERLLEAIRTVHSGEAVLAPGATRLLIQQFATPPPEPPVERPPLHGVLDRLTDREREVFLLMARGRSNREIATELYLSEHTIKIHVGRVLAKLDLRDRIQAVVLAYETGLIPLQSN